MPAPSGGDGDGGAFIRKRVAAVIPNACSLRSPRVRFFFSPSQDLQAGSHENRAHLLRSQGLWFAPLPTPQRLLRASAELSRTAAAAARDAREFRELVITAVLVAAAATGRVPVLPAFPCAAAAWLAKSNETLHGYDDPHFLTYLRDPSGPSDGENVVCAPYISRGEDCTDRAVFTEVLVEQDLLSPSYSHAVVTLPPAAHAHGDLALEGHAAQAATTTAAAAAEAAETAAEALRALLAGAAEHAAARILSLGGPLASVAALAQGAAAPLAPAALAGGGAGADPLSPSERADLEQLRRKCFDFFAAPAS